MSVLNLIQVILALGIIILVLLQSQGGGLGSTFGGIATYHTKRGLEKGLFVLTIVLIVAFTLVSLAVMIL
jgi:protein translocase SecG subunit